MLEKAKTKIITVTNQKGGVGKTTTAVNLATTLAINGSPILLIDLDPQGNSSTSFGIMVEKRKPNILNVLIDECEIDKAIMATNIPNMDIIVSTANLVALESLTFGEAQDEMLAKHVKKIQKYYRYIIIDTGPSLNTLSINSLASADSVLIPIQSEYLAMEGLAYLIETLKNIKHNLNKALKIEGILLTMFDRRNALCLQVEKDIREKFDYLVYNTVIPRNIKLSEAPSHGMPGILYDTHCTGSISYIMLMREFIKRQIDLRWSNNEKQLDFF